MVVLTSFTQPSEGIRHRQNNTTVYVNDNNLGKGTLFIAESNLSWVSDSGNGFSIEYPHISLHAVSRDLSAFPQECLFLMLDTALGGEETNNGNGENDDGHENGSEEEITEIRLVPDDRGMLEAMFHAMNACQALHPDPEDSFSDEDFYDDDEYSMEETEYCMAGLRIGSTAGTEHSCSRQEEEEEEAEDVVVGRAGGTLRTLAGGVEDMVEDRVVDMAVGVGHSRVAGGGAREIRRRAVGLGVEVLGTGVVSAISDRAGGTGMESDTAAGTAVEACTDTGTVASESESESESEPESEPES